jgi:pimeloyl-ACP methyl ester carboxylesterase
VKYSYNKYAVPESKGVPRDSTTKIGHVNFDKPHPPLLFLCGDKDQIVPAILNKKNYDRFKDCDAKTNSRTEFKQFDGLTHMSVIAGDEKAFGPVIENVLKFIGTL